jgi:hypothetical protein
MKTSAQIRLYFLLLVTVTMSMSTVAANNDLAGSIGPIQSIHIRSTRAKSSAFWNYVIIENQTYYWSGSVCPGVHLKYVKSFDTMVDALAEYATFPDMCIEPFYRFGQGGNLCFVSFTASIKTGESCDIRPQ